jgi:hypothetical protein
MNPADPLKIHDREGSVDPELRTWIVERLGHIQPKYEAQIDHIDVEFGDENKPRGHADRSCSVSVVMRELAPIAIEMRADSDRAAFDLAADRARFELDLALKELGVGVKSNGRQRGTHSAAPHANPESDASAAGSKDQPTLVRTHSDGMAYQRAARKH